VTKKKGISIGESLRGRMTSTPTEPSDVGTETKEQNAFVETLEEPTTSPQTSATPTSPAVPTDPLESFNTRLRQSTQRRLKVYSAVHNVKIQDVVNEALVAYLESKEG
jgi:hypothetical protein